MAAWSLARLVSLGVVASCCVLAGCVVEDGGGGSGSSGASGGYGYAGSSGGSSTGSSSGSTQPMLVDVDPNRTMSATPGNGVGVFTEYTTGGHWHVWWTCDTNMTGLPCSFDVTVSVTTGTIANLSGQTLEQVDSVTPVSSTQIEAITTTTTGVDGMTFDTVVPDGTTPIITLDAKLSGVEDPSFLFFVQNGQINGNYGGSLTDPLMLEPSVP